MVLDDWMPYVLIVTKVLLVFVSVVFFISGLDDFFVDMFHIVRSLYRRLFVMRRYSPLTEKQLLDPPEQADRRHGSRAGTNPP